MTRKDKPSLIATKLFQMCYEADLPIGESLRSTDLTGEKKKILSEYKKSVWTLTLSDQGRVRTVYRAMS